MRKERIIKIPAIAETEKTEYFYICDACGEEFKYKHANEIGIFPTECDYNLKYDNFGDTCDKCNQKIYRFCNDLEDEIEKYFERRCKQFSDELRGIDSDNNLF